MQAPIYFCPICAGLSLFTWEKLRDAGSKCSKCGHNLKIAECPGFGRGFWGFFRRCRLPLSGKSPRFCPACEEDNQDIIRHLPDSAWPGPPLPRPTPRPLSDTGYPPMPRPIPPAPKSRPKPRALDFPPLARPLHPAPEPPSVVLNPYVELLKDLRDILDLSEGQNILIALQALVRAAGRDTTKVDKYVEEYNSIMKESR